jgi:putative tryptophan/tyrosine transport system substrate-binding protein
MLAVDLSAKRLDLLSELLPRAPGGNVTGTTIIDTMLTPKRLELLREVVPNATRVGLLLNPNNPNAESQVKELEQLTSANGLMLKVVSIRTEGELKPAFESLANDHAELVLAASDALIGGLIGQIVLFAERYKLPMIYPLRAPDGLMSYGISLKEMYSEAGEYVGRIFKGEKRANLPVLQPTKVELTINFKAAKSLGITFPLSLIGRADEVIE